ncbi:SDR family NAD(P)-dependent oxidoreductase [Salicibibacter kimchii]|uniref:SDR family NAD(P)-dependent oxidoreductase n=1 Tax=Salicibibacter kimchii TaxID=2099786 RepID=A0A345BW46_9BACI|nr:SDR family NAD(P)-dependent oxidoreductase [Salicibibacter kimchii]AXF55177.1 SDR family NAD(P)-dependent oxidoreductase [Salicibibacter kimchii]
MKNILDLEGRIGMITGAGQGIGRQIALHFAAHNAQGVVVNDYHLERAEKVAAEIESAGGNALPLQADVTDYESVGRMVDTAKSHYSQPIDILVNNAGNAGAGPGSVQSGVPFWESEPESWEGWLKVNLNGVLNSCRATIPGMIEQKEGRIITIISDAGRVGEPHLSVYSAAKAGAGGFMRALAKSLGKYNINANSVAIGATRTPRIENRLEDTERVRKMLKNYVIRRIGEPDDIANMVLFLSSDASSWITGQTYPVNGGYSFNQ